MPSRWRQIAAIVARFVAFDEKSEPSSLALAMKSSGALWPRISLASFSPGRRHDKRRHAIDVLALGSKNFAARRQNCDARAKAQKLLSEYRHRVDEVLAIVKDEQEMPVADRACHGFGGDISSAQPSRST